MEVRVYRNVDALAIRKWVVELWLNDKMLDRRRMIGGLGFSKRLALKIRRMKIMAARAAEVVSAS